MNILITTFLLIKKNITNDLSLFFVYYSFVDVNYSIAIEWFLTKFEKKL